MKPVCAIVSQLIMLHLFYSFLARYSETPSHLLTNTTEHSRSRENIGKVLGTYCVNNCAY